MKSISDIKERAQLENVPILKDEGLDMDSFYQRIKEIINEERTN